MEGKKKPSCDPLNASSHVLLIFKALAPGVIFVLNILTSDLQVL